MKKVILLLLCSFVVHQNFAQEWLKMYQRPARAFFGITFTDSLTGYVCGDSGTILKTVDKGNSWARLNTGTAAQFNSIKFPTPQIGVAVGDTGSIFRTTDAGTSWQQIQVGFKRRAFVKVDFPSTDTGYLVGDSATVLKTTDAGLTWSSPLPMPLQVLKDSKFLGMDFITPSIGFACGGAFGNPRKTVFIRTVNGGLSWDTMASTLPSFRTGLWDVSFVNPQVGYATGIFGIVLKTADGGNSWSSVRQMGGNYNRAMYFLKESTGWVVGSLQGGLSFGDGMIKSTTDGGSGWNVETWASQSSDFTNPGTARLSCITTVGNDSVYTAFAVGSNGLILKSNYITSNQAITGNASEMEIFPNPGTHQIEVSLASYSGQISPKCFNAFGMEVPLKEIYTSSLNRVSFDIHSLSPGIYFFRISNGQKTWVKSFLKP